MFHLFVDRWRKGVLSPKLHTIFSHISSILLSPCIFFYTSQTGAFFLLSLKYYTWMIQLCNTRWSTFHGSCVYLFLLTFLATTSLLSCGCRGSGEKTHKHIWTVPYGHVSSLNSTPPFSPFKRPTRDFTCSRVMFATSTKQPTNRRSSPVTFARDAIALAHN